MGSVSMVGGRGRATGGGSLMRRFRKVDPRIWNDEKFMGLSNAGKLVFFFILTHPNMTALGAMRASLPGLAAEIGWESEAFTEAFREALAKAMLKHDEKASFVLLPNFLRYNRPESPNVVKAWISAADLLPECPLKRECLQGVKAFTKDLPKAFQEALPKDFPKDYMKGYGKEYAYTGAVAVAVAVTGAEAGTGAVKKKEKKDRPKGVSSTKPINQTQDQAIATYVDDVILPWHLREQFKTKIPKDKLRSMLIRIGEDHGLPLLVQAYETGANGGSPHPIVLWDILKDNMSVARAKAEKGMTPLADELADVGALFKQEGDPGPSV